MSAELDAFKRWLDGHELKREDFNKIIVPYIHLNNWTIAEFCAEIGMSNNTLQRIISSNYAHEGVSRIAKKMGTKETITYRRNV